jgi:outer membrane protein TolC
MKLLPETLSKGRAMIGVRNSTLIFLLLLLMQLGGYAQESPDTFTQETLFGFVMEYHPVARQASLLQQRGAREIGKARGGFDPYLFGNWERKNFDDKTYFDILNTGLKVPLWYGVEIKGGYDRTSGQFLNPENSLPDDGLFYAGLSVPVGQGLFIDQRRASLRQAQVFAASTEAEQNRILNDLLFEAASRYWDWVFVWNKVETLKEAVMLAEDRLDGVRERYQQGSSAAIDTLETFIQIQNRELNLAQAEVELQNARLALSNFLWFENDLPLEMSETLRPPDWEYLDSEAVISPDSAALLLDQLALQHPEFQLYGFKLEGLEIDRRWKQEKLKPKLDINYNFLSGFQQMGPAVSPENYKLGFTFSMPVLLRAERNDLQLTRIKIQEVELARDQKQLELRNKMLSYLNESLNLEDQIRLYSNAVTNYSRLLEAEKMRFGLGESSVFLVNSRENSLIEAQLKLTGLRSKLGKSRAALGWAAGLLSISPEP